jgi:hypothetical protein
LAVPCVLAVVNAATQGHADVYPIRWPRAATSLYFFILNESGGLKSTTLDELTVGFKRFERGERLRYRDEIITYNVAHIKWKKDFDKAFKDPTTIPGCLPKEPSKPIGHSYLQEKPTANGLLDALHDAPFCAFMNPDAAEFFNSHAFQDGKSGRDMEIVTMLSKLYSGEKVSRKTGIKENNVSIENRRFSMLAMIQPKMAQFLQNDKYKDQGFIPRLLISTVPAFKRQHSSFDDQAQQTDDAVRNLLEPFHNRIEQLLSTVVSESSARKAMNAKLLMQRNLSHAADDLNELELDMIRFDSGNATKLIETYYNQMVDMSEDARYATHRTAIVRCYEGMIRIAATLALFEDHQSINEKNAKAAIGLMDWFLEQRLSLDIPEDTADVLKVGLKVIEWMKSKGLTEIPARELQQKGPFAYQKLLKQQRQPLLEELESRGLIETIEDQSTKKVTIRLVGV